jgi:hypothetical protein
VDYTNRTKHEVIRGARFGFPQGRQYPAGYALHFDGTDYYVLKLWFQQERTYYISKNNEESDYYTVYSKKVQEAGDSVRFQNPIGFARGIPQKTHLEVVLPDFPKHYYMSLFPEEAKSG